MNFVCHQSKLRGAVTIPGSKSHTIRAVAIAALAAGESRIEAPLDSGDARSAVCAFTALGAKIDCRADVWTVQGTGGELSAPAGATVGAFDTTTITGTSAAPTATANDGTTVIGNNLILTKLQAVDSTCGAALLADSAFTNLTLSALPGYCIQYKIVVINNGATTNTAVHVYDTLPSYTAAQTPPAAAAAGGDVHSVTITGNSFDFNVGTLPPGNAGTCTFTIKISQ